MGSMNEVQGNIKETRTISEGVDQRLLVRVRPGLQEGVVGLHPERVALELYRR